jgi:hypothetical protein
LILASLVRTCAARCLCRTATAPKSQSPFWHETTRYSAIATYQLFGESVSLWLFDCFEQATEAKNAGADIVGFEDLIQQVHCFQIFSMFFVVFSCD